MDPSTGTPAGSTAHHIHQASNISSSQSKPHSNSMSSAQPAAAASPFLLPVELLVEILRYLSTSDVARAARVSSVWHAASNDSRIWRHLSFTRFTISDLAKKEGLAQLDERIKSFSARCGNTVESVDFSNLPLEAINLLAEDLRASSQTLKSIRSAPAHPANRFNGVSSVLTLAKQCASLETLELYGLQKEGLELTDDDEEQDQRQELCVCRPQHVKFSLYTCVDRFPNTALFSHVTTLKIGHASGSNKNKYKYRSISTFALHQLIAANPLIEKLTVHDLYEEPSIALPSAVTAPSLTFLELIRSRGSISSLDIDAPKLQELVIQERLLPGLSLESTAMLSALTLQLVGMTHQINELESIAGIRSHQGSLRLKVGNKFAEKVLTLLSQGFLWPGLEEVNVKADESSIPLLVSVMAARQAGSLGASSEQYVETASKAHDQLQNALRVSETAFIAQADQILAATSARHCPASAPPLCVSANWTLAVTKWNKLPDALLEWFQEQPNVTVARR